MQIRKATYDDLDALNGVYAAARQTMRNSGNMHQWVNGYPKREMLQADIDAGNLYTVLHNGNICAAFAFILGDDPTYARIEGAWKSPAPYGTVHRLASNGTVHGVARFVFDYCKKTTPHLRIDTHADNKIMQGAVTGYGFIYCGIIHIADGTPRLAYELL